MKVAIALGVLALWSLTLVQVRGWCVRAQGDMGWSA